MWLLFACATPAPEAPAAQPAADTAPDLVLVGVAGLRGDATSRAADSFAAPFANRGPVRFAAAYAQSTSAYASWGSILTGRYPSAIPLCGVVRDTEAWCNTIPAATPTLPQVLSLYGYRTALITTDLPHTQTFSGAFDHAVQVPGVAGRTDWAAVSAAAHAWWDSADPRPRLLVVATDDLLVQSRPDLLAGTGLDAVLGGGAPQLDRNRVYPAYAQAAGDVGKAAAELTAGLTSARGAWTFLFGTHGMNLADGAGAWQALRPDQPWNDILVDRTLRVPLLVLPPRPGPARRVEEVVELADLVPTLTRLAGAVPPANLPGTDLLGPLPADGTAYAEFGDMLAVRQGDWSYIIRAYFYNRSSLDPELTNFLLDTTLDPERHFLYQLSRDPSTSQNVVTSAPADAQRMHSLLRTLRTGPGSPPAGQLTDRRVWELRLTPSQGYW